MLSIASAAGSGTRIVLALCATVPNEEPDDAAHGAASVLNRITEQFFFNIYEAVSVLNSVTEQFFFTVSLSSFCSHRFMEQFPFWTVSFLNHDGLLYTVHLVKA